jgi:hypothetical protein
VVGQRALRIERRSQRILRAAERDEHRVASSSEIMPGMTGARIAQQRAMRVEQRAIAVRADFTKALRRALDVAEEEGDRSRWPHNHFLSVRQRA